MRRTPVFATVAAATALLWLGGCGKGSAGDQAPAAKKPPLVRVAPARRQDLARTVELTGDVVATNRVTLSATVEGPIAFCPWREGDRVDSGDRLIEIDRPLYREEARAAEAGLAVAQAKLADLKAGARPEEIAQAEEAVTQLEECTGFAESDMKRTEQMVKSGSLPGEALDKARVLYVKCRTQLVAAQEKHQMLKRGPTVTAVAVQEALVTEAAAKVATARAKLAECTIRAPFSGVVTKVYVRPGDLATAKAPLLDLMETDSLVVRFSVPEVEAAAVREGAPAQLRFDAVPDRAFEATVTRVYPELEAGTRTRVAEARPTATDVPLVPGMFARIALTTATAKAATVVPDAAVLTSPRGDRVVFVIASDRAEMRKVQLGLEAGRLVQILEGVQPGELVAVAGHEGLKHGAQVRLPQAQTKPATQPTR